MKPFNMKVNKIMKVYRPNNTFWEKWRADKDYLKEDGIRVLKFGKKYIVLVPNDYKEEEESNEV